jgi:hypothetical protein
MSQFIYPCHHQAATCEALNVQQQKEKGICSARAIGKKHPPWMEALSSLSRSKQISHLKKGA